MSGINPISGNLPIGPLSPTSRPDSTPSTPSGGKSDFGQTLRNCIDQVSHEQDLSASAIQDYLAGRSPDALGVVTEMAKSDLSFKLLMGVRNKVIEAYKQTMNMQV